MRQWIKKEGRNLLLLLVGSVIYGIGTHAFVEPAKIAPGGAAGTALLINHLTGAPVGMVTLAINVPLLILAWKFLSRRFAMATAVATAVGSVILDFAVAPVCPVYGGERMLGSLYGGILLGIGMALIFRAGMTTGGTDIVGYLLQKKYPHLSIGTALLAVDGVVLVVSIFVFGNLEAALFGLIALYAQTKVIDGVIYGGERSTTATVVTDFPERIAEGVIRELDRSATIVPAKGAYTGEEKSLLLCTVRRPEYVRFKRIVYETDPNAFVMAAESSEVVGLGFKDFVDNL